MMFLITLPIYVFLMAIFYILYDASPKFQSIIIVHIVLLIGGVLLSLVVAYYKLPNEDEDEDEDEENYEENNDLD